MNTVTPVTTPEGQHVTIWTEPRKGYPDMFTVRTTAEGGTVIKRDGLVQFCHVRGADRAIAEHANQVTIAQTPEESDNDIPEYYQYKNFRARVNQYGKEVLGKKRNTL